MLDVPYAILSIINIVIITLIGIIKLILYINNNKSKLVLKHLYYKTKEAENFEIGEPNAQISEDDNFIDVNMLLRNKGNKSTTIEKIWVLVDRHVKEDHSFKSITIPPGSSKEIKLELDFIEEFFKEIKAIKRLKITIEIFHTFGMVTKSVFGSPFETGWLHAI